MATPFVQGRLRNEALSFDVESECACCGKPIRFTMRHDLTYTLDEPAGAPVFFLPVVDFTRLEAPSIVDDF